MADAAKADRLAAANEFLRVVGGCGRRFFAHGDQVSQIELDARGRVWFRDAWSGARIYTHYRGRWRGFTQGGTLRSLVEALRDFVRIGVSLPAGSYLLGPWPLHVCDGDLWGYGADMEAVRAAARQIGLVPEAPRG